MTKNYVIYNGELFDLNVDRLPVLNRAFHYGDGVFETIRVMDGKAIFLKNHYLRFTEGLKVIQIDLPEQFDFNRFATEVERLIAANNLQKGARIRVSFFRSAAGFYQPKGNQLAYIMECSELPNNAFVLNENGLQVDIYSDYKKQISKLARHKSINAQLYILASIKAKENELDDVLLVNEKDIIIETTNANIFIASNRVLYTPPLDDGCVGGTMRMQIINIALKENLKVYETSLRPQNLLVADELFISNSIFGLKWVDNYRQKRYRNDLSQFLIEKLNEEARSV